MSGPPDIKTLERSYKALGWAIDAEKDMQKRLSLETERAQLQQRIHALVRDQRAKTAPTPKIVPLPPVTRLKLFNPHAKPQLTIVMRVEAPDVAIATAYHPNVRSYANRNVKVDGNMFTWPMSGADLETLVLSDEWTFNREDKLRFCDALRAGVVEPDALDGSVAGNWRDDVPCMPMPAPTPAPTFRGEALPAGWSVVDEARGALSDPQGRTWHVSFDAGTSGNTVRRGSPGDGWSAVTCWEPTPEFEGGHLPVRGLTFADLLARCARAEIVKARHAVRGAA